MDEPDFGLTAGGVETLENGDGFADFEDGTGAMGEETVGKTLAVGWNSLELPYTFLVFVELPSDGSFAPGR